MLRKVRVALRDYRRARRARARATLVRAKTPVFVHTHGKVGSSTVTATIHDTFGDAFPVYHTHLFDAANRDRARRKYAEGARGGSEAHLILSDAIAPYLEGLPFACYVITLTRNPIGRAISHAMQTLRHWVPEDFDALPFDEQVERSNAHIDRLLSPERSVSDPSDWFDDEVKGVFGVDVFAEPYDFERGYTILTNGPVRVLVMRMEDLDRALLPALSDLFERPVETPMRKANVGQRKPYADLLGEIKRTYRPGPAIAERVLSGRYYQHFYADAPERA